PVMRSTATSPLSPQPLITLRSAGVRLSDIAFFASGRLSVMIATRSRITHRSSSVPVSILVSLMSPAFLVIARREATKQSRSVGTALDCFAEPVIGPRFARTRWLAMTVSSKLLHPRPQFHFPGPGALRLLQHVPVAQGYRIGIEPGVRAIR